MPLKNQSPLPLLGNNEELPSIIKIYYRFNNLKLTYRTGWLRFVPKEKCESVAEHTLGVILLGILLAPDYLPNINTEKFMKMALIHDFGEIMVGDLRTTVENDNPNDKHNREKNAVEEIFSDAPDGSEFVSLWNEYEDQKTPEAIYLKKVDKIEMILQATVYENTYKKDLQEFFDYTNSKYGKSDFSGLIKEIEKIRPEFISKNDRKK